MYWLLDNFRVPDAMLLWSVSVAPYNGAKIQEIVGDTHQLQFIKLHHFKLERFKSI